MIRFDPPVLVASGCGGTGRELAAYGELSRLGGFVTRTLTLDPRAGGDAPRLAEAPSSLVHAVGLANPGLDPFLARELPWLVQQGVRVVVSLAGATLGELGAAARRLSHAPGVYAVEVNVSVPELPGQGLLDVREPYAVGSVVSAVRRGLGAGIPLLAKLRSDPVRVVEVARTAADAGADAVVVGNALPAAFDDGRPAGLSGPAIRPLALRCLAEVVDALPGLPVLGAGGVATVDDARAHLSLGACAVQVGAALLHDPTTAHRIATALADHPAAVETRGEE